MPDWGRWRRLERAERSALLAAAVLLPAITVALRYGGLRRTRALLDRLARHRSPQRPLSPAQSARLVAAVARRAPFRAPCLSRALTLETMLRLQGASPLLRIGVRKVEGRFEAHAWIEHEGSALMDAADVAEQYLPFARLTPYR